MLSTYFHQLYYSTLWASNVSFSCRVSVSLFDSAHNGTTALRRAIFRTLISEDNVVVVQSRDTSSSETHRYDIVDSASQMYRSTASVNGLKYRQLADFFKVVLYNITDERIRPRLI